MVLIASYMTAVVWFVNLSTINRQSQTPDGKGVAIPVSQRDGKYICSSFSGRNQYCSHAQLIKEELFETVMLGLNPLTVAKYVFHSDGLLD